MVHWYNRQTSQLLQILYPPTSKTLPAYKISKDSSSGIMMRPLITAATIPPSNSASILDAEEQTQLDQDEQQRSKGLYWNAFLLGSVHGFVFYGAGYWGFATYYSALKFWGQAFLGIVVLLSIWVTIFYVITSRSSSLYLLKKVDEDVGTPVGSSSIWMARMSLLVSVYFWLGCSVGSFLFVVGGYVLMGMDVPLMYLLTTDVVSFISHWLVIQYFDLRHNKSGEEQEDEEDQRLSCTQTDDDSLRNSPSSNPL